MNKTLKKHIKKYIDKQSYPLDLDKMGDIFLIKPSLLKEHIIKYNLYEDDNLTFKIDELGNNFVYNINGDIIKINEFEVSETHNIIIGYSASTAPTVINVDITIQSEDDIICEYYNE